jgi:transcriptional regulator with XRE-family HTH domain
MAKQSHRTPTLGELLRYWRDVRGTSQLSLSLSTGISQRHLSFVESGRSLPSRELLGTIAEALNIPLRERNRLLLAAGYAPQFSERALDSEAMAVVSQAIDLVLSKHEPYPAIVLDRGWNVVRANEAAPRFFASLIDLAAWPRPRNLLRLMLHPDGLRPRVENWELVAGALLQRVRREAVGQVVDAELGALLREVRSYPGVQAIRAPAGGGPLPVVPIVFRKGEERFAFFSLITTVGTPQCVTAQELRIECMYPTAAE